MEVAEFLKASFLEHAPIIPVSALKGTGLDQLKQALVEAAGEISAKDSTAMARLPIDRVFSMKGFGTVVTGTLVAGTIAKEQELELFPAEKRVRVRGVQVHGAAAERAVAGERTAVNLAAMTTEELARGMMLAPPDTFHATLRADVALTMLPSAKSLKDRARVHLHAYSSEGIAEVAIYGEKQVKPGQSSFAQLRLSDPALLLPGDRFILRQFSPVITIGGGVVLDAAPLKKKVRVEDRIRSLEALNTGSAEEILLVRISRQGKNGLTLGSAVAETGWTGARMQATVAKLLAQTKVVRVADTLVASDAFQASTTQALAAVRAFHDKNPLVAGIGREALREQLKLGAEVFSAVLEELSRQKKLEAQGDQVRLPGRGVVMKDDEAESKKIIETAFFSAGLKVPALYEVLGGLKVDKVRAQKIVTLLLRDKVLVKLSDDLVFHRDALDGLRKRLQAEKTKSDKIDVARFKDLTGVSRKYAIPLLEYLDRERVTRRVGNLRVIL
jgi:selenocysteine-specific elongation factor